MSKYSPLWKWISQNGNEKILLSFSEIEKIAGVPVDHSFLQYKKELAAFGYRVDKIFLKQQTVAFSRI